VKYILVPKIPHPLYNTEAVLDRPICTTQRWRIKAQLEAVYKQEKGLYAGNCFARKVLARKVLTRLS